MKIRKTELKDAEEIGRLIVKLAERYITQEFNPKARRYFLASNNGKSVKRFMESGFSYHIADIGGRVVGVVGVRDNSHLYHLFIDESHQGKGMARQLWDVAMADCISNGNPGVFTVNSSNYAVGVYESLGFVRTKPMQNNEGALYNPMELRVD